jgi:hypothetical protein
MRHARSIVECRIGLILAVGLTAALLAGLAGCHASSPRPTPADRAAPTGAPALSDTSYDWHGLLIAPFGSVLKEIPLTLHEVLLFRDEAHSANAAAEAECYAANTPPPRFVGRTPDEYLLCFKQDRLSRVQASVRLSVAEAPATFASACARWLQQSTPATAKPAAEGAATASAAVSSEGAAGPGASDDAAQIPAPCDGHNGAIHFSGRLEAEPVDADGSAGVRVLSITLDGPPAP